VGVARCRRARRRECVGGRRLACAPAVLVRAGACSDGGRRLDPRLGGPSGGRSAAGSDSCSCRDARAGARS
jgi:hypothetical protein